jgi:hypothetical protein
MFDRSFTLRGSASQDVFYHGNPKRSLRDYRIRYINLETGRECIPRKHKLRRKTYCESTGNRNRSGCCPSKVCINLAEGARNGVCQCTIQILEYWDFTSCISRLLVAGRRTLSRCVIFDRQITTLPKACTNFRFLSMIPLSTRRICCTKTRSTRLG